MSKTAVAATDKDRYLVPGLVRGLEVLQIFTAERRHVTLGDLAEELGVTRSAIFRVAYTLCQLGFLIHDAQTSTYALGPAVLRLGHGHQASRELVEMAVPHLQALRDATGWSVHLGVLEGRDVRYLVRLPMRRGVTSIVRVGSRLPAHATSMGRVLLAGLSEMEVTDLYRDSELLAAGARTPTRLPGILSRHRQDRQQKLIIQNGEFEAGVASIAAPLCDATGKTVAAINASIPRSALKSSATTPSMMDLVASEIHNTANRLSRTLGFAGSMEGGAL